MGYKNNAETKKLIKLYDSGYSCEDIGKIFDLSRQAVWERMVRNGKILRKKKILPFIIYDGIKFTPSGNGYYRATSRDKHISLHRYKYEKEIGVIPEDYDIHHKDGNRQNNNINNYECLKKSEHTRLHQKIRNKK